MAAVCAQVEGKAVARIKKFGHGSCIGVICGKIDQMSQVCYFKIILVVFVPAVFIGNVRAIEADTE